MKYRRFGSADWEVSAFSLGSMRLPAAEPGASAGEDDLAVGMIRYAVDAGVNYLDLGYPYDLARQERICRLISRALQDGYRKKVKLTATLPISALTSSSDCDRYLNGQLRWLETDKVEFLLLATLNRENWPKVQELGVLSWAERSMSDGPVGRLGFSFHDHYQPLRTVIAAYDHWALCQFQFSYMDVDHDPGVSGIKYAADKGLAVVVTEPLRGGRLAAEPPESVAKVWAGALQQRTLAEWGLRFVWNLPEIATVVGDVGALRDAAEYIAVADNAEPDGLSVQELVLLSNIREAYQKLNPIRCTSCRACMPCPEGIDVPRIFEIYNDAIKYRDIETGRCIYRDEQHWAANCTQCGACVAACAKSLPILDWLRPAHDLLTSGYTPAAAEARSETPSGKQTE
jgi:predicted aldo/keto reductase-like oxidoreductase